MAARGAPSLPTRRSTTSQSKAFGAGEHDFPAAFTVDGSNRHEFIIVNPGQELGQLRTAMAAQVEASPNCVEFMHKYRSAEAGREVVREVRVRWAMEGRDGRIFPRETRVTEENCEAVLRMMAVGVGRDVFDIHLEVGKAEGGEKK